MFNNNKINQLYYNKETPLFFNQKQLTTSKEIKETQEIQQPVQEISAYSSTDILLAAILKEFKKYNQIECLKLIIQLTQEAQKQKELEEDQKMQELNDARFKSELQFSMYA